MSGMPNPSGVKAAGKPPQAFSRWPPINAPDHGLKSRLVEESESLPLPFLSRECRVEKSEWSVYLRRHAEWRCVKAKGEPAPVPHSKDPEQDVEAPSAPGQLGYNRVSHELPLHPICTMAITWRIVITLVDASYSAFLIPIACAFHWNVRNFSWYNGLDCVGGAAFWIDLAMGFSTGFVVVYNLKRLVVLDLRLIAEFYMFRGTFLFDLISALPIIAEVVVLCIPSVGGQTSLHVIFLLRLARMYRVFKMIEWLLKVSLAGHINKRITRFLSAGQMFLFSLLYAGLVMINLLTCLWYYVASWEGLDHSWLLSVGPLNEDISAKSAVRQWVASFHFVTATVTTVGYGDIAPVSAAEELVAGIIMLIGIILFGFIIAGSQELVQYLAPEARTLNLLRHKMQEVDLWASKRCVSARLQAKCNTYFTEVWLHETELHESTVFWELPAALQADVCYEMTKQALDNSEIFKVLNDECRRLMTSRLRPSSLPAGHDLCRQGDKAESLWIIEEGEVLVLRHGSELELLTAPAILGETAILADAIPLCRRRPYSLRAVTPCMLWRLDNADMEFVFDCHPEFLEHLLLSFRTHLKLIISQNEALFHENQWSDVIKMSGDHEALKGDPEDGHVIPEADDKDGEAAVLCHPSLFADS